MGESNRITVCASLLSTIINSNKELLVELQFTNAIGRYRKEHPVLDRLVISDELVIDATQLPDSEAAVIGIKALIKAAKGIMEIFLGNKEAEEAIMEPAKKFLERSLFSMSGIVFAIEIQVHVAGFISTVFDEDIIHRDCIGLGIFQILDVW